MNFCLNSSRLRFIVAVCNHHAGVNIMKNEATVLNEIRIAASQFGGHLWRNNSGVLQDKTGRPVRFGLGNDSRNVNSIFKSSDLIGVLPLLINESHLGKTLGVFAAVECKAERWQYNRNDKHVLAQHNFINLVNNAGGIGAFCNDAELFDAYLKGLK